MAAEDRGVVVELRWRFGSEPETNLQYQALKMRDGLIFDMQDFRRPEAARRALR